MTIDWKLNDLYIISKGRPECITARMLKEMGWPDDHWHIMCEDDDPALGEYKRNWGEHVLTFPIADYLETTDYLDNEGTTLAHGAAPVRNAVIKYSHDHGELRHWQFDDDYTEMNRTVIDHGQPRNVRSDYKSIINRMNQIAVIGQTGRIPIVGGTIRMKAYPQKWRTVVHKVFNMFNIDSNGLDPTWRGRLCDDTINCLDVHNSARPLEIAFNCVNVGMQPTQSHRGGLTDLYGENGTIRKVAYALLVNPTAVIPKMEFGRIHNALYSIPIQPKLINPDDVKPVE